MLEAVIVEEGVDGVEVLAVVVWDVFLDSWVEELEFEQATPRKATMARIMMIGVKRLIFSYLPVKNLWRRERDSNPR